MNRILHALALLLTISLNACQDMKKKEEHRAALNDSMVLTLPAAAGFSASVDGKDVSLYSLKNREGMQVLLTNYGATVVSITAKDRSGRWADVALGYDDLAGYQGGRSYFGAIVGRYANRIARGKFSLDGKAYSLFTNNGPNSLHGGKKGFDKVIWDAAETPGSVSFHYLGRNGEEGYPGNLDVTVTYTLSDSNTLAIDYKATTDKATVLNLSNHTYFNLRGQGNGDILGHQLQLFADAFTPVDSTLIPTGEIRKVAGTAFDFTTPHTIGERVNATEQQIVFGKGYDHNFVLMESGKAVDGNLRPVAIVKEPESGRVMAVSSNQPAVQFYCGNFLDGSEKGKGSAYGHRTGFCLETQHYPDGPNQPGFPSTVLKPGQVYSFKTVYAFSVSK
jgi:aldose 1-epimerase